MRTLVCAVTVAGMLLLSGCGGGDPIPTLPPTPTATPIFASEEEALAAAEEAYAAYLEMSNLIGKDGGVDPHRIEDLVTSDRLETELRGFETLNESGLRLVGSSTFEVVQLQRVDQVGEDAEVVFYACWDGSGSRVFNEAGEDVTPLERVDRLVLEVTMVTTAGQLPLVLASDDAWPDSSC
jgi:hypothetical protein